MPSSDPHALAIAALAALGTNLVAIRGRVARANVDVNMDSEIDTRKPRGHSRNSARRRSSASSRSTTHTTRTISSRSSSKSSTKSARSKAKSTTSRTSKSKASSLGKAAGPKRVVVTVAQHPKAEKYVPPPRGTFRSSYTRFLRAEVLGEIISELESAARLESTPLLVEGARSAEPRDSSSTAQPLPLMKRPPTTTLTAPTPRIDLEDLPTLALSEFDFFSASRSWAATSRETSEVWSRSPAAPAPPNVRRWLKNARTRPEGTVEEV